MTTNKLRNFSYSWYGQRDMAENGQEKKKKASIQKAKRINDTNKCKDTFL